jgi:hypothetical protein
MAVPDFALKPRSKPAIPSWMSNVSAYKVSGLLTPVQVRIAKTLTVMSARAIIEVEGNGANSSETCSWNMELGLNN